MKINGADQYRQAIATLANGYDEGLLKQILECEVDADFFTPIGFIKDTFSLSERETFALCVCADRLYRYQPTPELSELVTICTSGGRMHLLFSHGQDGRALCDVARRFITDTEFGGITGVKLTISDGEELFHHEDILHEIERFCSGIVASEQSGAVLLHGKSGSGRTFLLKTLADKTGGSLLCVNADETEPDKADEIAIAAQLYRSIVCIKNAPAKCELANRLFNRLPLLFFISQDTEPKFEGDIILLKRSLGELNIKEKVCAITALFNIEGDEEVQNLASLYNLSIGGMIKARQSYRAELLAGAIDPKDKQAVMTAIKTSGMGGILENAQLLTTNKKLCDVILPSEQEKQLKQICSFITNRKRIYNEWNFVDKIPYGRGITALFYGASGTGKTLAATAMANELGLELYRVDLSQLISKYIGETQKNIGRVFDEAKDTDCILFFDEADALFSRRTDTSDSADKHSNAEIAYLLQRTERYDGTIFMATNLLQNLDEAFRRRIGYMIQFPMPDESLREAMWANIFPNEAPTEDINFGYLAKHIELSGAGIRNCAVGAALLAAGEGGSINMQRIIRAAQAEYKKQNKTFSQQVIAMFAN